MQRIQAIKPYIATTNEKWASGGTSLSKDFYWFSGTLPPILGRKHVQHYHPWPTDQIRVTARYTKASTKLVIKFLISELYHKLGIPKTIVSDNGTKYVSREFADMTRNFGIQHTRTALYSPQANASDRVNQSILSSIGSYLAEDHTAWDTHLPAVESSLRSSGHSAIGATPYFALFGVNMITAMNFLISRGPKIHSWFQ